MCTVCVPGASGGQRRMAEPLGTAITDGLKPPYRYWELNAVLKAGKIVKCLAISLVLVHSIVCLNLASGRVLAH